MTDVSPGWYKDPADPTTQRYWDGEGWVGEPIPADATPPGTPPAAKPAETLAAREPEADKPAPEGPGRPDLPGIPVDQLPPGTPLPPGAELPGARVLPPGSLPPGMYPPGWAHVIVPAQRVVVTPHGYALASLGSRLVARLIDMFAVLALNVVVNGYFGYLWWQEVSPYVRSVLRNAAANQPTDEIALPQRASTLELIILLVAVGLWIAYEVPAIANTGQTLGKRVMQVKVLGVDTGKPVGVGRALRRWIPLGASMTLWTCYIGFILQFLVCLSPVLDRPLRRAWHDRSAGTLVVRAKPQPEQQAGQLAPTPEDGTAS